MAEIIVIDDSADENDDEELQNIEERKLPHILEMENLTEKLKRHFSSIPKDCPKLVQWRMKLNPFRTYGYLSDSEYAFKSLEGTTSDDFIPSINIDEKLARVNDEKVIAEDSNDDHTKKSDMGDLTVDVEEKGLPSPPSLVVSVNDEIQPLTLSGGNLINSIAVNTSDNIRQNNTPSSSKNTEIVNSEVDQASQQPDRGVNEESHLPYYLKNFIHILKTVLNSRDKRLFKQSEIESIQKFVQLSLGAKLLYTRLYQRKKDWFRCDKIQYPQIADDLTCLFKELINFGYFMDEKSLVDFDDICDLLTANETRSLADDIKLKVNKEKKTKHDIINLLKKHCQKQRTIFMTKNHSMLSIVSKNAKKFLGTCVSLSEECRSIFTRAILLFCLTTPYLFDTLHSGQRSNILYQMLLSNLGELKYPLFKLNKVHDIFENREQLIEYTHAVELENDLECAMEKKDFTAAMKCYEKLRPQLFLVLEDLLQHYDSIHCLKVPSYLSCFSKEWVTLRIANKCVDVLEKERNYPEAVTLIELLLAQMFMRSSSRGFLWERLILDCERYIKDTGKAYLFTIEALKDPYLRTGHRYDVLLRNKRLGKSPKITADVKPDISFNEEITKPKEEIIRTNIFLESSVKNRAVFLSPDSSDNYKLSNVEQHVIMYYQKTGFPSGKHGEGSTVTTLFFLLFWDIIFMDVADVFQSEFQNAPLDMFYDSFYKERESQFNERLNDVYHASDDFLRESIQNTWSLHYGTHSVGVSWDLFDDEFEAGDLAVCLGGKILGGICELFCKDFRRRKGGFPDLIVWNAESKCCKIIEVKGPGDKLSVKQIIWLDILSFLGADAFACYVTGVGGKRKRTSEE